MSFKRRTFLHSIRVAVGLLTFVSLTLLLQAQTTATDPGPRPTGKEAVGNAANAVCPVTGHKFPKTVCLDFVQPPSVSPAPAADGAGDIVANPGNLGGTWFEALTVFSTIASVNGSISTTVSTGEITGLGPSFNAESCFQCHSQPAVGGSSPGCVTFGSTTVCSNMAANASTGAVTATFSNDNNPQIIDATDRGATGNSIFAFINDRQNTGPLLEVRFPKAVGSGPSTLGNPASVPAGAVAELYVITGRNDAPSTCAIDQIDFASQVTANNVIFRIPIPTFGDGFVENTPETSLLAAANAAKAEAGTTFGAIDFGVFNTSGNDATITRFGWKAQNKSLLMFAGEASNVEMGVTNELFPTERTYGNAPDCTTNQLPEDVTQSLNSSQIESITGPLPTTPVVDEPGVTSSVASNIESDSIFMRLNGAPAICDWNSGVNSSTGLAQCLTVGTDQSVLRGAALFGNSVLPAPSGTAPSNIGCVFCHWQTQTTGPSTTPTLSNAAFHPFSDFALHHMGGLADSVRQGSAAGDQFRTAPLWGLGQRLFFLHDGRDSNLIQAITDHCIAPPSGTQDSEACTVVTNFTNLPPTCTNNTCTSSSGVVGSQQDLINFLRSL